MPLFLQNPQNFGRSRWKKRYSTPEIYQEMMKETHRMATEVDAACGKNHRLIEGTGCAR